MSSPGLTPEWATIILDSHQKNFADECAICFSEINHDFRIAHLSDKTEELDDVASAGTAESEDFAVCGRHNAVPSQALVNEEFDASTNPSCAGVSTSHSDATTLPRYYDAMQGGGLLSPAESCISPHAEHATHSEHEGPHADDCVDKVQSSSQPTPGSCLQLDAKRHPDELADDIMAQAPGQCNKEQLEFLYRTCRYVAYCRVLAPNSYVGLMSSVRCLRSGQFTEQGVLQATRHVTQAMMPLTNGPKLFR